MKVAIKSAGADDIKADLLLVPLQSTKAPEAKTKARTKAKAKAKKAGKAGSSDEAGAPQLTRRLRALDRSLGGVIGSALASGDFSASPDQRLLLYPTVAAGIGRVLLVGMGPEADIDAERLRRVGAMAAQDANGRDIATVAILMPGLRRVPAEASAGALAEGAVLGAYRFDGYRKATSRKRSAPRSVTILYDRLPQPAAARAAARNGITAAESQCLARDLSNEPGNEMPPSALAAAARKLAREVGLQCTVLRQAELEKQGFGALLAVGGGSANPPHLIVLQHRGRARRGTPRETLCLVGKGITFDSGGISIKPAANMGDMKHDMSGAAAVIGAMRAIALQKLPAHVVGIIAAAENMPSGTAYRPGDIVRAMSGTTIEVANTDAEGRVVLADALHYARTKFAPAVMIDLATLTGAAMVAFGPWATAVLGNDEAIIESLRDAGAAAGERVWPLPLLPEHRRATGSLVADLKNSAGRDAGVSTAAAFLQEFVGDTPWVHLDIAGTGWTAQRTPYHRGGGTGVGVRLLLEWVRRRSAPEG
jgi:leucyl aminopeptidase